MKLNMMMRSAVDRLMLGGFIMCGYLAYRAWPTSHRDAALYALLGPCIVFVCSVCLQALVELYERRYGIPTEDKTSAPVVDMDSDDRVQFVDIEKLKAGEGFVPADWTTSSSPTKSR